MTTQLIEAARLALEVLEAEVVSVDKYAKATTELRAALSVSSIQCEETSHALEQPARGCDYCNHLQYAGIKCKNCGRVTEQPAQDDVELCSTQSKETFDQPKREWVGLTGREREDIFHLDPTNPWVMMRLVEAKLKEKNS